MKRRRPAHNFEEQQRKIDLRQLGLRAIRMMVCFSSTRWGLENLALQLRSDESMIEEAMEWACKNQYAYRKGRKLDVYEWYVTNEGRELVAPYIRNLSMVSDSVFRDESLAGMDDLGQETKITNAVLPANTKTDCSSNRVEDAILAWITRSEYIRMMAAKHGTTSEMIEAGAVHVCNQCKVIKLHHRSSRGHEWQSACIDCRRANRKNA